MAQGPETRLVGRIRKAIVARYPEAYVVKISGGPYQSAGLPDLLVVVQGHLIGIEVKCQRSGESYEHALSRVTLRQQAVIDALREAGATAGVALSSADALGLIEESLRE